jgi:hypothetical protein
MATRINGISSPDLMTSPWNPCNIFLRSAREDFMLPTLESLGIDLRICFDQVVLAPMVWESANEFPGIG